MLQAQLWNDAGLILFSQVGAWEEAEEWLQKAQAQGHESIESTKNLGHILASRQDFKGLLQTLRNRAEQTAGLEQAEAYDDAGLVAKNSLKDERVAVDLLERAIESNPGDWFALRLLREIHDRNQNWGPLSDVLESMASLTNGAISATLHVERGRLLEKCLSAPDKARLAYQAALDADSSQSSAFIGLERLARKAGEHRAAANLYAAQVDQHDGADKDFWATRLARALGESDAEDNDVLAAWSQALASQSNEATRGEQQHFLRTKELWEGLAQSLAEESERHSGPYQAYVLAELGQVRERQLDDVDGAIQAWTKALEADPNAGPARDALIRLLGASGQFRQLLEVLQSYVDDIKDPNLIVTTLYRMGELCEGRLQDQAGARQYFERILDTAPGYLPALEGLERVYTRLEAWEALGMVYEQRAVLSEEGPAIALQLHRAGAVYEYRMGDEDRAREFYRRALDHVPDFPPSLDAYLRVLEKEENWKELAQVLANAAEASSDANQVVSLAYRSARVLADCVRDNDAAMEQLRRCLNLSPGFLPALGLLRELAAAMGDWKQVQALQRQEADSAEDSGPKLWRLWAAAGAQERLQEGGTSAIVDEILEAEHNHPGAIRLQERLAWSSGDLPSVVAMFQQRLSRSNDELKRMHLAVRAADLGADLSDTGAAGQAISEVAGSSVTGAPKQALATVAETLGYWEHAQRLMKGTSEGARAAARLGAMYGDEPAQVATAWRDILNSDTTDTEAAAALERALIRLGSRDGLAQAHEALALHSEDPRIQSVHALLAGHLMEAANDTENATKMYRIALDAQPARGKAMDALLRVGQATQDAALVRHVHQSVGDSGSEQFALSLIRAGDPGGATSMLTEIAASKPGAEGLYARLLKERALEEAEDWAELFAALSQRREATQTEESKARIESKRRWVLAEKLSSTDEAWDFYRQLHEEAPQDADVLEALARIAGARGETALAIQYLEGLSEVGTESDRARYLRRIAEARIQAGDTDRAREAYHQALDVLPGDLESVEGLKSLARNSEAWPDLIRALAIEASLAGEERQLACFREIAQLWTNELNQTDTAKDSWKKVLDFAPTDSEALHQLVALCRNAQDWPGLLLYGQQVLENEPDAVELKVELGMLCLDHLNQPETGVRLLGEASDSPQGSLEAGRRLENHYLSRGAYDEAVEAIRGQARATEGPDRINHLLRAARMLRDTLRNREGAAQAFQDVLTEDPGHFESLQFRGDYLFSQEEFSQAILCFEAMVEVEQSRDLQDFDDRMEVALYYFRFAEALRRTGQHDEAVGRYRAALEANPNHLPSLEALAPILVKRESWQEAKECYRMVLQLTGGQGTPERLGQIYSNLGRVELALGNVERARKRVAKALEHMPDDVASLEAMANIVLLREEWHNVLGYYNKIIAKARESQQVIHAFLMKSYVLDAKLLLTEKAKQHYLRSLAFDQRQPTVLLRLAELSCRSAEWDQVLHWAGRGLALEQVEGQTNEWLNALMAVAHFNQGNRSQAASHWPVPGELGIWGPVVQQLGSGPADWNDEQHAQGSQLLVNELKKRLMEQP